MKSHLLVIFLVTLLAATSTPPRVFAQPNPATQLPVGMMQSEFIFEAAPFAESHAATIESTPTGLVAAWFGGTAEGKADVGIWLSRRDGVGWSTPVEVAVGRDEKGKAVPCWNPVLFQPKNGPLMLFYKVGPSPKNWWGMLMTSSDGGASWSSPQRLPNGILGPIKNKPIELADGTILCPSSTESGGWRVHIERTSDFGKTWEKTRPLKSDNDLISAIQPSIMRYGDGRMQLLCRTKQERIAEAWSRDDGRTWSELKLTPLPNPNSGTDALALRDRRALLVYNHATRGRAQLNVAVSDDGRVWQSALELEDHNSGEYSYPAVIQSADGLVHIVYTWKRERIKYVVLDPKQLVLKDMLLKFGS